MSKLSEALEAMDKATPGLKPCPFCGKQPQRYATICDDGSEYNIQYYCNHGQESAMNIVETGYFGLEEHAFNCWNTRNPDALAWIKEAVPYITEYRDALATNLENCDFGPREEGAARKELARLDALIARAKPEEVL